MQPHFCEPGPSRNSSEIIRFEYNKLHTIPYFQFIQPKHYDMKQILTLLLAFTIAGNSINAQQANVNTIQEQIVSLEKSFAEAIKMRDSVQAKKLQAETYFLAVGIKGQPLRIVPRNRWLLNLQRYVVESYSIDDIKVNVYGNTAVALLLFTQKATTGEGDRSAQFVLTDIWVKEGDSWLIAERHSSRPEMPATN